MLSQNKTTTLSIIKDRRNLYPGYAKTMQKRLKLTDTLEPILRRPALQFIIYYCEYHFLYSQQGGP